MEWWGKQPKEIQEEAFGDHERCLTDELTKKLNKWCVGLDYIWCSILHLILLFYRII